MLRHYLRGQNSPPQTLQDPYLNFFVLKYIPGAPRSYPENLEAIDAEL